MKILGYNTITWLKICLTNKYDMKTDFPWEKVFVACALVKSKVGKMHLFLQASSRFLWIKKKLTEFQVFILSVQYVNIKAATETALL